MNYHVEHHMFPMVPYHALPRLHELIKARPPAAEHVRSWTATVEMCRAVRRQLHDPEYDIRRELPPTARPYREEFHNSSSPAGRAHHAQETDRRRSPRDEGRGPADHAPRHDARRGRGRGTGGDRHRLGAAGAGPDPQYRDAAPSLFSMPGQTHLEAGTRDDYLRWASGDEAAPTPSIAGPASRRSSMWPTSDAGGGPCRAGAQPRRPGPGASWPWARRRSRRWRHRGGAGLRGRRRLRGRRSRWCRSRWPGDQRAARLLLWSMGAGAGCDAQYLFAEDILGTNRDTCRATPRSTATSPPSSTACRPSGWRPSANSSPTSNRRLPKKRHLVRMSADELATLPGTRCPLIPPTERSWGGL